MTCAADSECHPDPMRSIRARTRSFMSVALLGAGVLTASAATAAEPACGGFEQRALRAATTPLLHDRLKFSAPEGAALVPALTNLPLAEAATVMETRVALADGDKQLTVISNELGALAPAAIVERLKANSPRLAQATFRETTLPSGLRVVLVTHDQPPTSAGDVPLAHAFSVLADGTLQATRVVANPAVMAAGGAGCVDLALRMLSTLAPGKRSLDLSAGIRKLHRFELSVPQGTLIAQQQGPDFDVYRVLVVRELGAPAPQLNIYVGRHPNYTAEPNAKQVAGAALGKPVTWLETTTNGTVERETLIELPDTSLHLFLAASSVADAEALTKTASTLRDSRASATPVATAAASTSRRWLHLGLALAFACAAALVYAIVKRRGASATVPKPPH